MDIAVLAIETATDACSVAVLYQDTLLEHFELTPKKHTQIILPCVHDLLLKADLRLCDIDVLAFGRGPGSFTGVRIATSVIQGLAYGSSLPVIPISTLQALAQGVYRIYQEPSVFCALDARQEEIYCNAYVLQAGIMQPAQLDYVVPPQHLSLERSYKGIGVGSGCRMYQKFFNQFYPNLRIIEDGIHHYPQARDIATLAYYEYQKGHGVPASQALPVYLRDKVVAEVAGQ